jgi:adenosylhomocysteinase
MQARTEGFIVGPLNLLLSKADIIIGATGHCSVNASDIRSIKSGAVVASASSKQVEFDVNSMNNFYEIENVGPHIDKYYCGEQHFYLLSNGYPINFRDNSILGPILDAIYSELFLCIREIMEQRVPVGLVDSWPALHEEVAEAWCNTYLDSYKGNGEVRMAVKETLYA